MNQKEHHLNAKKPALTVVSAGESLLILGLGLLILSNFLRVQVNFMLDVVLLLAGIIAILIACALLIAPFKTALNRYLGLSDEEQNNDF